MVRAIGSYPIGHKFESHRRYHANKNDFVFNINIRPVGQAVKTPPFHGGNMGSSPVRVTSKKAQEMPCAFLLYGDIVRIDLNPSVRKFTVREISLPKDSHLWETASPRTGHQQKGEH